MSKHETIQTERAAAEHAMTLHLRAAVDVAMSLPGGQSALGEVLCAMLENIGSGSPAFDAFGNMRDDAAWWADLATPMELEIYAGAALRRIKRTTFAERARKRLFWALWGEMAETDKAAFLARVEREQAPP